jgi:hypothetical protein
VSKADVEIEEIEITVADIKSKLSDLPRGSDRRSVLRMLSVGMRPHEITSISDLTHMKIRRMLNEMFPDKEISLHDFRKLFMLELAEGDFEVRTSNYFLDHQSYKSISTLEKKVQEEGGIDPEGLPEKIQEKLEDIGFESGEKLLGRFHLYLTNETDCSPGDNVDYVREMDYQLGLNPEEHPVKRCSKDEDLSESAREYFGDFLDSSYVEKPVKPSEEGDNQ